MTDASLRLHRLVVGALGTNCYVLADPSDGSAIVVDPADDAEAIASVIGGAGYRVVGIVDTHGHGDHIGANGALVERFGCPLMIHELDAPSLVDISLNLSAFLGEPFVSPAADRLLVDGDVIQVGTVPLKVIHTPGHTVGGISLYTPGTLISGDTLFARSIGRVDFPGGSHSAIIDSIRNRLFVLPDETKVYPGHGPETTIGWEQAENPYLF